MFQAIQDFRNARRRAVIEQMVARLTGRSADLLAYDDVRAKLKARGTEPRVLREIPLDAIVGSVGRYTDFTRSFLPRSEDDETRWARVRVKMDELAGLPPIDVYQIGEVYFVRDGNHRVSVARELGATQIEAYVTEVETKVPLTPDVQPDDLIVKAEYADFLERTQLDEACRQQARLRPDLPETDLTLSIPGQYGELLEQIDVYRYFLGQNQQREIPYSEAVTGWHDEVYVPVIQAIRQRGLLAEFPGRTEADLYLWISRHRAALREALEWEIEPGDAAADLAQQASPRVQRVVTRLAGRVLEAMTPDELEAGPSPGNWRREHLVGGRPDRLFTDILVPVSGQEVGWRALHQALEVARREQGRLFGLYVVLDESQRDGKRARAVKSEFERRCDEAGIPGRLAVAVGRIAHTICDRARWTHLICLSLAHPPEPQPGAKLRSGFRSLVRRCSPPMLAVPGALSPMDRALLAYDGSPKAQEALFVATYLTGQWHIPLVVLCTADEQETVESWFAEVGDYLQTRGVQATFVAERGSPAEAILRTAGEHNCDLILLGGYGRRPLAEVMLGSTVDELLRTSPWPMLICR